MTLLETRHVAGGRIIAVEWAENKRSAQLRAESGEWLDVIYETIHGTNGKPFWYALTEPDQPWRSATQTIQAVAIRSMPIRTENALC
jgi:hypothetical protein